MVKKNLSLNPVVLAAFICAACVYAFPLKIKASPAFCSLLNEQNIASISGEFSSNVVRSGSGKYYSAAIHAESVSDSAGTGSQAKGKVSVLLPAEFAEAFLPGKYFTKAKENSLVCEQGKRVRLYGRFAQKQEDSGDSSVFVVRYAESLPEKSGIVHSLLKIRGISRINFRRLMYSWGNAGGLLLALLSGIREYTEADVSDAFRLSGLSHVLALSGMHLSLFSGLFKKTGRFLGQKLSSLLQILAVLAFVWFAGISPSLFRAMLCSMMLLFLSLLNIKNVKMLSVLSVSFLAHIILRREDIVSLSFILSYGALAGILVLGNFCSMVNIARIPSLISSSLGASAGAQIFTAPVSLRCFSMFAPAGIISTVIISPLISIFIYSGLFFIFLCLIFPVFVPFSSFLLNIQYNVIKQLVLIFAAFPYISTAVQ